MRSLVDIYASTQVLFAGEPVTYEEAKQEEKWVQAMEAEIEAIERKLTQELTELPLGKKNWLKWIFKTKMNLDGSIHKHKTCLLDKGHAQFQGIDIFETFAPVARFETVVTLINITATKGWKLYKLGVKTTFLNGILEEDIYVEQPVGFENEGSERMVYKLKTTQFWWKQATRAWYKRIVEHCMNKMVMSKACMSLLYIQRRQEISFIYICLYVDDIIYTGNSISLLEEFKVSMKEEFEMTYLRLMKYFLGIEERNLKKEFLSIGRSIELLKRFNMADCKPIATPMLSRP